MTHLAPVFSVWNDNAAKMADAIGELAVTVRQWRRRKNIPPQYWAKIIQAASNEGHFLTLADFLPNSGGGGAHASETLPVEQGAQ